MGEMLVGHKGFHREINLDSRFQSMEKLDTDCLLEPTSPDHTMIKIEGGLKTKGLGKRSRPEAPLITVITVVLNAERHLEDSIRSVINQNYENVEYIILDGGSTDGTMDVITKYDDRIDYWASEKDQGIYDALNKAVKIASGDWLYVLGADDILLNVLHLIAKTLKTSHEIYYGDVYLPGRHEIIRGEFTRYRLMYTPMTHQGIFYPKEIFTEYCYDIRYPYAADYELEMRCFNDPRFKFVYMPVLVAIYNDTEGKSARNEDHAFIRDRKEIIRKFFPSRYYYLYCIRYFLSTILKTLGVKELLKKAIVKG